MKEIDPHRISLILAILFIIGLGATAFSLYSLDAEGAGTVWLLLTLSTLAGGFSIVMALRYQKEIIVYKDRSSMAGSGDSQGSGSSGEGSMDLSELQTITKGGSKDVTVEGLKIICKQLEAGQGAYYEVKESDDSRWVELTGGYALSIGENTSIKFDMGEGLIGQSAAEGKTLYIDEVPEGYMKIASGLGMASPRFLLIAPVKKDQKVVGVLEVSTFKALSETQRKFVEDAAQLLSAKA
jgi:methyl-accepting chemotaxis protein